MPLVHAHLQYVGLNTAMRVDYLTLLDCLDIQYQHSLVAVLPDEQYVLIAYRVEKHPDIAPYAMICESVCREINHREQNCRHDHAYYRCYNVQRIVVGLHISHTAKSKNVDNRTYQ